MDDWSLVHRRGIANKIFLHGVEDDGQTGMFRIHGLPWAAKPRSTSTTSRSQACRDCGIPRGATSARHVDMNMRECMLINGILMMDRALQRPPAIPRAVCLPSSPSSSLPLSSSHYSISLICQIGGIFAPPLARLLLDSLLLPCLRRALLPRRYGEVQVLPVLDLLRH